MNFLFYLALFLPFFAICEEAPARALYRSAADNSQANSASSSILEGGLPSLVNGSVNVVSGKFYDYSTDLLIPGAEPLVFERNYSSGSSALGADSVHSHHSQVSLFELSPYSRELWQLTIEDGGDDSGYYETREKDWIGVCYNAAPFRVGQTNGMTNLTSHPLSGKSHIKNSKIYYQREEVTAKVPGSEPSFVELFTGSGAIKHYSTFQTKKPFSTQTLPGSLCFVLTQHVKSNGNSCRYGYDGRRRLASIQLFAKNNAQLARMELAYLEDAKKKEQQVIVTGSHQRAAYYKLKHFKKDEAGDVFHLVEADSPDRPKVSYEYAGHTISKHSRFNKWLLAKKTVEGGYFEEIEYYEKGENRLDVNGKRFEIKKKQGGDAPPEWCRVRQTKAPLGTDATPIPYHSFEYKLHIHKSPTAQYDVTKVFDAYNHKKNYSINRDHRLEKIEYFTGTGRGQHRLYKTERFRWGKKESGQEINLMSHGIENAKGQLLQCRTLGYDKNHNLAWSVLHGNLTGNGDPYVALDDQGHVIEKECWQKHCVYSEDGKNLLLYERDMATEKECEYQYWQNTDRLAQKVTVWGGIVRQREFYQYDERGMLCESIVDNGTSRNKDCWDNVSERFIKRITYTTSAQCPPCLPSQIEEICHDSTGWYPLKKTVNHYNAHGWLIKQDIYDSQDNLAYSLSWKYDERGNCILSRNALGQATKRRFDVCGNLVYEKIQGQTCHFEHQYDLCNRLIHSERVADTGERWSISHKYDYLSNRVSTVDIYGNETRFVYDDFNRLVQTIAPPVADESGRLFNPCATTTYNELNQPEKISDPRGLETRSLFTVFGKPYVIHYPNGSIERFEYYKNGTLKKAIETNGSYTLYTRDYLDRVVKKESYSAAGELLSTYSYVYNSFHVLAEIDPSGHETQYQYRGGRLSCVIKDDNRTTFTYDALGRLTETKEYAGPDDYVRKIVKRDLLDRVVEESIEDAQGNIQSKAAHVYDEAGNCIEKTTYGQAGAATVRMRYDAWNQVVELTDAVGTTIKTHSRYDYHNEWGQRVPYTETIDPLGQVTTTICNAHGKPIKVLITNSLGNILKKEELFYDASGNKVRQQDTVIAPDAERQVVTAWEYDAKGRVVAVIESVHTPEQKTTRFGYNLFDQLEAIYKPDGNVLLHTYDALGRLSLYTSSDGSISYSYSYDSKGNLIKATDQITGKATIRTYDAHNQIIYEELENGLSLDYTYDGIGRLTQINLPDASSIAYRYKGSQLHKIVRQNSEGEERYAHTYAEYDLMGKVLTEELAGQCGVRRSSYNVLGRLTCVDTAAWKERIEAYDLIGNVLRRTLEDHNGPQRDDYAYDAFYQLASEQGRHTHTYQHDSLYNRVKKDDQPQIINGLNQVLRTAETEYQYDLNGNRIRQTHPDITYTYDALDRLVKVQNGDKQIEYTYDSYNRRMGKTVHTPNGSKTEQYLYVQNNEIGSYADGEIRELRVLGLGLGAEIGAAVALELAGKVYVPMHDHNGHVMAIVDAADNQIAESYSYTAFGEEPCQEYLNPWRFSSKRVDPETGLIWFGRRLYDPQIGRWTTPDPLGLEGGPNLYAYVRNNPLNHIDLYGLVDDSQSLYDFHLDNKKKEDRERKKKEFREKRESQGGGRDSDDDSCGWNPLQAIGQTIQMIADHILPLPTFIREGISRFGHWLAGGSEDSYDSNCLNPHSQVKPVGGELLCAYLNLCSINGVLNSMSMCEITAEGISGLVEKSLVHAFYNSSRGLFWDAMECVAGILGICTYSVHMTAQHLSQLVKDAKAADPTRACVIVFAHSQGGLILYRALQHMTKEERASIRVVTVGSAKMMDKSLGLKSFDNYVNTRDPIPFIADPIGCLLGALNPDRNVHFLQSNGFFDHMINHDNYQQVIRDEAKDILQQYGKAKST